ncbi:MAG: hypothetical protein V3T85_05895, partial [Acidiferrobacterales bacterium]
ALARTPGDDEACRAPAGFCGRWRRRRWLWELWPKPKFLVCRDETRLIYLAGQATNHQVSLFAQSRRRRYSGAAVVETPFQHPKLYAAPARPTPCLLTVFGGQDALLPVLR